MGIVANVFSGLLSRPVLGTVGVMDQAQAVKVNCMCYVNLCDPGGVGLGPRVKLRKLSSPTAVVTAVLVQGCYD